MEKTIYSKYSNERSPQFCIRTDIVVDENGERAVYKYALQKEGYTHITHMKEVCRKLTRAYDQTGISICVCEMVGEAVRFPYIEGRTLQDELECAVGRNDMPAVALIVQEYVRRVLSCGGEEPFKVTPEFLQVFGENLPESGLACASISDIDLIFSNIILTAGEPWEESAKWNVIDYEWTFDFPIPKIFILYRAVYLAYHQILNDTELGIPELLEMAGITKEQAVVFAKMEEHFQDYLGRGVLPIRNMQRRMGTKIRTLKEMEEGYDDMAGAEVVPESDWIRVKRIFYHIDQREYQDGSVICRGWAVAKTRDGRSLPVNIRVVDQAGNIISAEVRRYERSDVAGALKIRNVTVALWGFDCVWTAPPRDGWKIYFFLGNGEKIYAPVAD